MQSFEDLGLPSEVTEALSAEGFEEPTEFQRTAIPLLRRGNNLLGAVGPGAGTLLTYGTAILERTEPRGGRPGALVLVPTDVAASGLAESLAHIAAATGHSVGAFGGAWSLPEQCDVLFATPGDVKSAVDESSLTLEGVQILVVDGAGAIETVSGLQSLNALFEYVEAGTQRVVLSQPVTESVQALVTGHVPKAVRVPSAPAIEGTAAKPPDRGELRYRITGEDKVDVLAPLVSELLVDDTHHVLLFCRSADRAADVGDLLTLHGFMAGAPGDETVPVWLAVDALPAREALNESTSPAKVATLSLDCPSDPDTMDRRHGAGGQATVMLLPREVPHFRDTARRTGYRVRPLPPPESAVEDRISAIRGRLEKAATSGDLAPLYVVLEPLLERFSPQELAAAALALLIARAPEAATVPPSTAARAEKATGTDGWTRLFVSIGEMEGVKPSDLLGALAGESGVDGTAFGKIEIRDTYSLVEVRPSEAEKVIKAVNGSSIRGRSARVDYDRGSSGGSSRGSSRGIKSEENRPRRSPRSHEGNR
jgi:ATP-dependent RNA helicase DeaD